MSYINWWSAWGTKTSWTKIVPGLWMKQKSAGSLNESVWIFHCSSFFRKMKTTIVQYFEYFYIVYSCRLELEQARGSCSWWTAKNHPEHSLCFNYNWCSCKRYCHWSCWSQGKYLIKEGRLALYGVVHSIVQMKNWLFAFIPCNYFL